MAFLSFTVFLVLSLSINYVRAKISKEGVDRSAVLSAYYVTQTAACLNVT